MWLLDFKLDFFNEGAANQQQQQQLQQTLMQQQQEQQQLMQQQPQQYVTISNVEETAQSRNVEGKDINLIYLCI